MRRNWSFAEMQPFSISESARRLIDPFPLAGDFKNIVQGIAFEEHEHVCRLWLSEGIPFAFRTAPMLYETMRAWIGGQLDVHPKSITLIGSGRMGYSLAPSPAYGREFSPESDLDFSVVSEPLFVRLREVFAQWQKDLVDGHVRPRSEREAQYWAENTKVVQGTGGRGFIDADLVPNLDRYREKQRIAEAMYILKKKLGVTPGGPRVKKASI
jgi:hypothetical protein